MAVRSAKTERNDVASGPGRARTTARDAGRNKNALEETSIGEWFFLHTRRARGGRAVHDGPAACRPPTYTRYTAVLYGLYGKVYDSHDDSPGPWSLVRARVSSGRGEARGFTRLTVALLRIVRHVFTISPRSNESRIRSPYCVRTLGGRDRTTHPRSPGGLAPRAPLAPRMTEIPHVSGERRDVVRDAGRSSH